MSAKKIQNNKKNRAKRFFYPQPLFVSKLYAEFSKAEVYLVGGAVRDMFLQRTTKDYDFVVRNVPITTLQKFLKKYGLVRLVGKKFGVLKFLPKNNIRHSEPFDIALPRTEHSDTGTGHYRDFKIKTDYRLPIEDDLSRRDFTINALALNLKTGAIVDPFGGGSDIKKKLIRAVGKPTLRFSEDYSRILRAIRFACQFGFRIEQETEKAIRKNAKHLNKEVKPEKRLTSSIARNTMRVVPYEVVAKETVKAFIVNPVYAFDFYDNFGIFKLLMPELLAMKKCPQERRWHSEGDVWEHTRLALSVLSGKKFMQEFGEKNNSALLAFSMLFHDIGKPPTLQTPQTHGVSSIRTYGHDKVGADMARHIAERLRMTSASDFDGTADELAWLVRNHLLILTTTIDKLRSRTIEKYFYDNPRMGQLLVRLVFCDSSASLQKNNKPGTQAYQAFKKRRVQFEKQHHLTARKRALPPSLLNGDDIMWLCKIKPGICVGELRDALREEQLSGRVKTKQSAEKWLMKECRRI